MGFRKSGEYWFRGGRRVCSQVKREILVKNTILGTSAAVSIQVPKYQNKFIIWV